MKVYTSICRCEYIKILKINFKKIKNFLYFSMKLFTFFYSIFRYATFIFVYYTINRKVLIEEIDVIRATL